ncbi:uncharacterized protein LOC134229238 [Saccostrea cucullata]|uniref:uncharacterized protein LOC134229238 n=1 Tax=Saccostrea cuccullata TaxID=36930 RepID=UPI002ED1B818
MATGNDKGNGDGTGEEGEEISIKQHIDEVNKDPNYKVLTKEEYKILVNAGLKQEQKTSTPFKSPGWHPFSPMSKLLNTMGDSKNLGNVSMFQGNQYPTPKLPTFSGTDEPQKGEVRYEVWNFEVKCLLNSNQYPEHILLQAVRNSLKGLARSMLVSVGDKASIQDILRKLDGFFGNVASGEKLMQSFYNDCQKEGESIVVYASRLEDTLSKAIKFGHIGNEARDGMLRSKFWTGLSNQQLKQSTRHLFDTIKNFESLLREIRKVQEEITSQRSTGTTKQARQAFQQAERAETTPSSDLQKELQTIVRTMERLEQKIDSNTKSFQQLNKRVYDLEINTQRQQSFYSNRGTFTRGRFNYSNRGFGRGRGQSQGQIQGQNQGQSQGQSQGQININHPKLDRIQKNTNLFY